MAEHHPYQVSKRSSVTSGWFEVRCVDVGIGALFDWLRKAGDSQPRRGMPSPRLGEQEFKQRFRMQFTDPLFDELKSDVEAVTQTAWEAYAHSRKSPRTRKAGGDFSDPDYELSVDWVAASEAIKALNSQPRFNC